MGDHLRKVRFYGQTISGPATAVSFSIRQLNLVPFVLVRQSSSFLFSPRKEMV